MFANLRILTSLLVIASVLMLSACAPKVGSPEWCKSIEEKPKGDLTLNETKDYAKHCVFK
jgi:protein involved in sex pheromone biosynthesis